MADLTPEKIRGAVRLVFSDTDISWTYETGAIVEAAALAYADLLEKTQSVVDALVEAQKEG